MRSWRYAILLLAMGIDRLRVWNLIWRARATPIDKAALAGLVGWVTYKALVAMGW